MESELATLRTMNHKLRYSVYIPKKDDTVDRMLGDYVNGRPEDEAMKIMFLRESEGVYRFGSKRVYIKAEKGGKIVVRVGGGFMGMDEFIDQYSFQEEDRIQRKDVVARFASKMKIQQISTKADGGVERSPVRSPVRARMFSKSPVKSSSKKVPIMV